MLRKCPNCGKKLFPITYKLNGFITRHYHECECGWSSKPQVLIEQEAKAKAEAEAEAAKAESAQVEPVSE